VLAKTWTLQAIRASIDSENEAVILDGDYALIVSKEGTANKIKGLFKKAGRQRRYVEIDLVQIVEFIVNKLAPHVDIKEFLKELVLLHSSHEEILELKERLKKGYVSVKGDNQCYSLMVGGKRGRPYEFNLVG